MILVSFYHSEWLKVKMVKKVVIITIVSRENFVIFKYSPFDYRRIRRYENSSKGTLNMF